MVLIFHRLCFYEIKFESYLLSRGGEQSAVRVALCSAALAFEETPLIGACYLSQYCPWRGLTMKVSDPWHCDL